MGTLIKKFSINLKNKRNDCNDFKILQTKEKLLKKI
jgi:hypothetical protein